jgi:hypothetical protein
VPHDENALIAIARRFNDAWNSGDIDAVMAFFADDATVRIVPPPAPPDPERYTGQAEIRGWVSRTLELPFRVETRNYRALDDIVTWDARFPHEGRDAPEDVAEAVIVDGRIKDFTP